MRTMGRSSDGKSRKVTPPSPSYMSNDQFANYLSELRNNRVSRPGGARPPPSSFRSAQGRYSTGRMSLDASSQAESLPAHQRTPSEARSIGAGSVSSRYSTVTGGGRDYYPSKPTAAAPLKPSEVVPTDTYMERGQRWMEKEEAFSLRDAMDEMDLRTSPQETPDEESRIYAAALDEASELVWQHQNGGPLPRPDGPYRYKPHLRKNSYAHARTASVGRYGDEIAASGLARDVGSRSVSGSSTDSDGCSRRSRPSVEITRDQMASNPKSYGSIGNRSGRYAEGGRRSSMKRNISGEVERPFSGNQIWEEPEAASSPNAKQGVARESSSMMTPQALGNKQPNPLGRVRFQASREDVNMVKPLNRVEIHRNPPSQSRDARYTTNAVPELSSNSAADVEMKNGVEVRGQDIRNATSMRMKDRSPRLPEPTAVSDSPGRPIVSFNADWRAPEESTDNNPDQRSSTATAAAAGGAASRRNHGQPAGRRVGVTAAPVEEEDSSQPPPSANVPTICVAEPDEAPRSNVPSINVPSIAVNEPAECNNVPVIVTPADGAEKGARPLPAVGTRSHQNRRAQRPQGHWSPAPGTSGRVTAICHECGFPIEGRFVALAGCSERFHPACFSCFTCGTGLEAMEISPEPDSLRNARVDRIRRRAAGEVLDEVPGMTEEEDGDDRLRFFCHLDWHEAFAPRCKHCTTPILGEHIVALGEHWHYGHFFCAECGDPFEQGMTHIEKDGYAWCIRCQTKRTERRAPKCRRCRTAVIGEYIQALGGEWHEQCFRCAECRGGFSDGQIFPKELEGGRGAVVLCTGCRAKELKL